MRPCLALLTLSVLAAAQDQTHYVRATYTKWKPGKATEGMAFIKDVPYRASQAWAKDDPDAVGQITMTRVLPAGNILPYDRLRLTITNKPQALSGARQPGSPEYVKATGFATAEYSAKLSSFFDTFKTEMWASQSRYGTIKEGDYVQVRTFKVPTTRIQSYLACHRDWEKGMRAEIVKSGRRAAQDHYQLLFTGGEYPYNFVALHAHSKSDGFYQSLGSRQELFLKVHPGKDYHIYISASEATEVKSVDVVTYRVDLAVWK